MDHLIQGRLDNVTHTISNDQLRILYEDNRKEAEESRRITESTYCGEFFSLRAKIRTMNWIWNFRSEILKQREQGCTILTAL